MEPYLMEAAWTWTGESFHEGIRLAVGPDGRLEKAEGKSWPCLELPRVALLPGFVNAHSHAFQRGLRGQGEKFPDQAGDFWSWRQAMYRLVESLDPEHFYRLSLEAFREMLAAGITTTGEFHYLHHQGREPDYALDEALLAAAREAGIRLVLLSTYYQRGGFRQALAGSQRRFASSSPAAYLDSLDRLAGNLRTPLHSLGMAAHSLRAARLEEVRELHRESRRRGMVFHMHVEEQAREVRECLDSTGARPLELLTRELELDDHFTAVHCTHSESRDMEALGAAGANVCLCPLTEANLGDGVADPAGFETAGVCLSVGTDSNARIAMTEEVRWLEYVQRLRRRQRGCLRDRSGSVARRLLEIGTRGGARSLGIEAGEIAPGKLADLLALDLKAPGLHGATPETLLESFLLGTGNGAITAVCVGGRWSRPLGRRSS